MAATPMVPASMLVVLSAAMGLSGCENLTGSPGLPSGTPNPSFYNNKTGAIGMYTAAVYAFEADIPSAYHREISAPHGMS